MVIWTVVKPTASVCRVFLSGNNRLFLTSCLLSTSTLLFLTSKAITYTMFDYDINCSFAEHFWFFLHNLFTKANVLPNVIKISCARGRHNMLPPFYTACCGPARLRQRRLAFLASSSCGRHEYSQCMRQTNVRRRQTSVRGQTRIIAKCLAPYRGGGIIN